MKKLLTAAAALAFITTSAFAQKQTYNLFIENPRVVGNELRFDIAIQNTSSTDIYIGDSDFIVEYNTPNFANPQIGFIPAQTAKFSAYQVNAAHFTGKKAAAFNLFAPVPSSEENFKAVAAVIPASGDKIVLGQGVIKGISNTQGTAGLRWATTRTSVYAFSNTYPRLQSLLEESGTFINPDKDVPLSGLVSSVSENPSTGMNAVSIFPNPAKEFFTLKTSATTPVSVSVFSSNGAEVFSVQVTPSNGEARVDIPATVASGNYVVKVQDVANNAALGALPLSVAK